MTRDERERLLRQKGAVVWFTGLSGSGKSTIAYALEARLTRSGHLAYVLDGDNIRHGLNAGLGFSDADRRENIRRIGEVAAILADAGVIAIASLISPFRTDRALVRSRLPAGRFFEVFVDTPLETCEQRDTKGLYARARTGSIPEFTGISSPYEPPAAAELTIRTAETSADDGAAAVESLLRASSLLG